MAARIEPLMTVDDLDAMPEDGNRYEVIEGELFVSRAPGVPHQRVTKNAIFVFESYLIENPIGEIIPTPGLIFGRYSGVIPDLVFYTHERAKEILSDERLTAAPELVIENTLTRTRKCFA
jgi:Uma2 family endonuclease